MKILISIFFIVLLAGCMSADRKAKVHKINPTLSGSIIPNENGYRTKPFVIRVGSINAKDDFKVAEKAAKIKAKSLCREEGYSGASWEYDGSGGGWRSENEKRGNFTFTCDGYSEKQNQIVLIDKAKELCTNIGYTPNTDSHRGCVVELMKVDSGGTNVTVNSTNYQDMIDRGICMTTGKCDITGQPIIKQSQNTITNARCRVTGTGAWKTIQCF